VADLSLALTGSWSNTVAKSVWSNGATLYVAGFGNHNGSTQALLWSRPQPCLLPGDMNSDSRRDGADVQRFVNCLLGTGVDCACADVDGNGVVNSADVAGLISALLS
jgi:hypothetical protein